jgi:hypothetical protein
MTTAAKLNRDRRKVARAFLRDAQLSGISNRSRAVLAYEAVRLCTTVSIEEVADRLRSYPGCTDEEWQTSSNELIAYATKILKTK